MFYKWQFFLFILPRLLFAQEIAANSLYKENGLWGIGTATKPVTPAVYDTLISIDNTSLLIAKRHKANGQVNNTGVVSFKGKNVIPHEYLNITHSSNGLIVTQWVNGETRYGVLSLSNEIILNTRFKYIRPIQLHWLATSQNGEMKLYDREGKPVATIVADSVASTENPGFLFTYANGKKGVITISGLELSAPEYKTVSFQNGHWEASAFPTWQVIQESDTVQIKADSLSIWNNDTYILGYQGSFHLEKDGKQLGNAYQSILPSGGRLATTMKNDRYGAISINGKELLAPRFQEVQINSGYLFARKESQWALYDSLGGQRNVFEYDSISFPTEGLFPIKRKGKWGFMDRHGVEVIHCIYDSLTTFREDKAIINYFGKKGIINKKGDWEVKPVCDDITGYSYDFYIAKMGNQYYLKDYNGEIIYFSSSPIYEQNGHIEEYTPEGAIKELHTDGSSSIKILRKTSTDWKIINVEGKYGFEGQDGLLKVTYRYDSLLPFSEDLSAFKLRGKWGFIDRNERIVIQPVFTEVTSFANGLAKVIQNGKYGLVDIHGSFVLKPKYDKLKPLKDGVWLATENGQKGLYNHSGEVIVHPLYDYINYVNKDLIIVRKGDKYGIVDQHGSNILPRVYDYIGFDKKHQALLLKKDPERTVKIN